MGNVGKQEDVKMLVSRLVALSAFAFVVLLGTEPSSAQTTIYVDDDAPLGGDGTTWSTAFKYLQDALNIAASGDQIHVASGSYTPDRDEGGIVTRGDREASFRLADGLAVFGGYAGWSKPLDPDHRDIDAFRSCLTGDLDGDDVYESLAVTSAENSYHVVRVADVGPSTILDGFTITAGRANGPLSHDRGGGMWIDGSPTIRHCFFYHNAANWVGGAIKFKPGGGTLTDCVFVGNTATQGGGIFVRSSDLDIANCTFVENTASDWGGGLFSVISTVTATNCIFASNTAGKGGGVYSAGNFTMTNCALIGNRAEGRGGAFVNISNNIVGTLVNCTFSGNSASSGASVAGDSSAVMTIANSVIWGDIDPSVYFEVPPLLTYSDVEGGFVGIGNVDSDPGFRYGPLGTWTSNAIYDPESASTTFTDNALDRSYGELIGLFLKPQSSDLWQSLIIGNTDTTISVLGDFADSGVIGADYHVIDYSPDNSSLCADVGDNHGPSDSPCIDAGDNLAVPLDTLDLDYDGDTMEPIPFDLDGGPRFVDDLGTMDTGNGIPPIVDMGAYEFQVVVTANLDFRPGLCPNRANVRSRGVLRTAVVGSESFDVTQIDVDSLVLTRADGAGGSVAPLQERRAPNEKIRDVATPFEGDLCDCHRLRRDGVLDLALKFSTDEVVQQLGLDSMPRNTTVMMTLTGSLLDGTPFEASDCVMTTGGPRPASEGLLGGKPKRP